MRLHRLKPLPIPTVNMYTTLVRQRAKVLPKPLPPNVLRLQPILLLLSTPTLPWLFVLPTPPFAVETWLGLATLVMPPDALKALSETVVGVCCAAVVCTEGPLPTPPVLFKF